MIDRIGRVVSKSKLGWLVSTTGGRNTAEPDRQHVVGMAWVRPGDEPRRARGNIACVP